MWRRRSKTMKKFCERQSLCTDCAPKAPVLSSGVRRRGADDQTEFPIPNASRLLLHWLGLAELPYCLLRMKLVTKVRVYGLDRVSSGNRSKRKPDVRIPNGPSTINEPHHNCTDKRQKNIFHYQKKYQIYSRLLIRGYILKRAENWRQNRH